MGRAEAVERRVDPPVPVRVALHRVGVGHEQVFHGVGVAAGAAQADHVPTHRPMGGVVGEQHGALDRLAVGAYGNLPVVAHAKDGS